MSWAPIVAGVAGGLFADSAGRRAEREARRRRQEALNLLSGLQGPSFEDEMINLTPGMMGQYLGDYIAEQEEAVDIDPSKFEDLSTDPRLTEKQFETLSALETLSKAGVDESDEAMIEDIRRAAETEAKSRQASLLQGMQERGIAGGGAELAAQLAASQAATEQQAAHGRDITKMIADRKMQALGQVGDMSGKMRAQEFGEKSDIASALDAAARFRAQNVQGVRSRNVGARNQAGLRNIDLQQSLADRNAELRRGVEQHRAGLHGARYAREFDKRKAMAEIMSGQATAASTAGANRAGGIADITTGIVKGLS